MTPKVTFDFWLLPFFGGISMMILGFLNGGNYFFIISGILISVISIVIELKTNATEGSP